MTTLRAMADAEGHSDPVSTAKGLSPISKLAEDLLWRIFMANTDNPDILTPFQNKVRVITPRPLQIARISSQVCREWRGIILSSTSIWGRLIDFVSFSQKSNEWRDEVISRCGTLSLLWVVEGTSNSHIGPPITSARDFLLKFISDNWERIEKLFVTRWSAEDWGVLCRSAPNLKAFEVHSRYDSWLSSSLHISSIPGPLFAGHSPHLHTFQTTGSLHCNLSIGWMANLRELLLGHGYNNQEVLVVLQHLPRLESLELNAHGMINGYHPPVVHLPRLHSMNVDKCLEYLRSIEVAPGCSFSFRENRDHLTSGLPYESAMVKTIYHSYVEFHPPERITLMCTPRVFGLHNRSILMRTASREDYHTFDIHFESRLGITEDAMEFWLEAFNSAQLSKVADMCFFLHDSPPRILAAFRKFMMLFTSMECLWLNEYNLRTLLEDGMTSELVFPRLKILRLGELSKDDEVPDQWKRCLDRFLTLRRQFGAPIQIIDLSHLLRSVPRDLDNLEEHTGMKVLFKTKGLELVEYECGSGRPEVLRFKSQPLHDENAFGTLWWGPTRR